MKRELVEHIICDVLEEMDMIRHQLDEIYNLYNKKQPEETISATMDEILDDILKQRHKNNKNGN